MEIKICGIKDEKTATVAVHAGATHVGIVVDTPASPRTVGIETATRLIHHVIGLGARPVLVSMFLNNIALTLAQEHPDVMVQFHGVGDPHWLQEINEGPRPRFIIGISPLSCKHSLPLLHDIMRHGDVVLVDGSMGRGNHFRKDNLREFEKTLKESLGITLGAVFLAGGLTPSNVKAFLDGIAPRGVDASSGLESAPGVKDPRLIGQFCSAVLESNCKED